jgi:hypothetical protein
MSEALVKKQAEVVDVGLATPPLRLPDAASTAEVVLTQAMEYCAQKMGLGSAEDAIESLKQGDSAACRYCSYSVAKQVAGALAALDENVKAVYVCDYDATPEDLCFGEAAQVSPVHVIVWTERKTNALNSLITALDRALAQNYASLMGLDKTAHVLDAQLVDDADVQNRTGYGALFSSLYHRPIQVWGR